ncbi:MAG: hypothetical protein J6A69_06005 [Clostridia bacterium]|nr:hypothetical protein [Clostridia bacterium]
MKKILCFLQILVVIMCSAVMPVSASDYVGTVNYSPIVMYINNYPIPSYVMDGYVFVQVEDLTGYGFDIKWNEYNKSLRIIRNDNCDINYKSTFIPLDSQIGKKNFDFYTTEVKTYIGNYAYEIECLAGKPGCTYINVENLEVFGELQWLPELNHMKLWIRDGLECYDVPFYVPKSLSSLKLYRHFGTNPKNAKNYYQFYGGLFVNPQIYFWYGEFTELSNGEIAESICCPYSKMYVDIYDTEGKKVYTTSKTYYNENDLTQLPYIIGAMDAPLTYEITVPSSHLIYGNDYMARVTFWCNSCQRGNTDDIYFTLM